MVSVSLRGHKGVFHLLSFSLCFFCSAVNTRASLFHNTFRIDRKWLDAQVTGEESAITALTAAMWMPFSQRSNGFKNGWD